MAQNDDSVSIQTLVVAICIAVAVGFFGGVIYSSLRSGSGNVAPMGQQAGRQAPAGMPPMAGGQPQGGLSPQQASMILSLEQRVAANANDADAWLQLGNTYFDSNNFLKAIDAYKKYLAIQPNNPNALTDLGIMYRNTGQTAEAIATFDRAMAADSKHVQAAFNKGIVLLNDMHDPQGALAVWQKLVADNPGATSGDGMPVAKLIEEVKQQHDLGKGGQ